MIIDLPHIGRWNIDRIVRVTWSPAKWHLDAKPHVARDFIWWGKPRRVRDGWSYYEPACVRVWSGSGYDDYIRYDCKPGEPERWREEILSAIAAAQAAPQAERIVAAAVRTRILVDDEWVEVTHSIPPPARHHTIIHAMHRLRPEPFLGTQGFITSTGRWVDRQQAMGIAVAAGQVPPEKVTAPRLFSEDLW